MSVFLGDFCVAPMISGAKTKSLGKEEEYLGSTKYRKHKNPSPMTNLKWFFVLGFVALTMIGAKAQAQDDMTLNYQGILSNPDGRPIADGDYDITFRIYTTPTGGTAQWTEPQTLNVRNGVFNTTLGLIESLEDRLDFEDKYYLSIRLEGGTELTPRIPFTSSAYSFFAANIADSVVTSSKFRPGAVNTAALANNAVTGEKLEEGAVSSSRLADGAVVSEKIADGAVSGDKLDSEGAVAGQALVFDGDNIDWGAPIDDSKIASIVAAEGLAGGGDTGEVTLSLAEGGVDSLHLATAAVGTNHIATRAVTREKIATDAIPTNRIVDGAVTDIKLADSSVTVSKIDPTGAAGGSVLGFNGADVAWLDPAAFGDITEVIAGTGLDGGGDAGTVTLGVANLGIDTEQIANGAVTGQKVSTDGAAPGDVLSFDGANVDWVAPGAGDGDITAVYAGTGLSGGGLTGDVTLNIESVDTDQLADNAVSTVKLQANSVRTNKINNGAVTGDKIETPLTLASDGSSAVTLTVESGSVLAANFEGGIRTEGVSTFDGPFTANARVEMTDSLIAEGGARVEGGLIVHGTVSKGGGSFMIDHPLDPENKYLYHSFVESPDMMNIYNGNVVLDENGTAVVTMPDWFDALNKDFRYQLTCVGGFAPVYVSDEIANGRFRIAGGTSGLKVSWQVTGIRNDPYARMNRIQVEVDKPASELGTYLYPEAQRAESGGGQTKQR